MRVDALAVKLRPRPMAEAADLGVLLVRTHARSIWLTWGPVFAATLLLAAAVEAFWSSAGWLNPIVKYGVAAVCWTAVLAYFLFQGRRAG